MEKDDEIPRPASDERRLADATATTVEPGSFALRWQPLRAQLSPLIGENGFSALFGRAVSRAAPHFDCLSLDAAPKTTEQWFAALESRFSSVDATTAGAAHAALREAFTRQLSSLIGNALTERLLAAAEGDDRHDLHRSTNK